MSATVTQMAEYCLSKTEPKPELRCSGCGTTQEAACSCGVAYAPVVRAGERARQAVLANREKSDRAIALEINVDHKTVAKERRKLTGENSPVEEKRIGLDGNTRRMPKPPKPTPQAAIVDFKKRKRADAKAAKQEEDDHRKAFLLRADASREYAELEHGKVDDEMIRYAEAAFAAWGARVEKMKMKREVAQ